MFSCSFVHFLICHLLSLHSQWAKDLKLNLKMCKYMIAVCLHTYCEKLLQTNKETKKVVLNYGSYDGYDENLNQEVGFRHIFEISSC